MSKTPQVVRTKDFIPKPGQHSLGLIDKLKIACQNTIGFLKHGLAFGSCNGLGSGQ
jgi:hypothetical protein